MKILIASAIDPETIAALEQDHDVMCAFDATESELIEVISDREALIFRSGVQITAAVMAAAPDLELIIRAGSGFDNIDLEYLASRIVRFVRIPGPGAKAVAELSFAMMLSLARRLRWADSEWRAGNWVKREAGGLLLTGKTLGIVGAGNIGRRTGRLGAAWGMRVLGCVEHPGDMVATHLAEEGIELASFDEVLDASDFVSVHVPLKDSTRGLFGAEEFTRMKTGSILVNLSRGGVVDEVALRQALVSGKLAAAGLDVHAVEGNGHRSALADLDNVLLTPHIGASTVDSQREIGLIMITTVAKAEVDPPTALATPDQYVVM